MTKYYTQNQGITSTKKIFICKERNHVRFTIFRGCNEKMINNFMLSIDFKKICIHFYKKFEQQQIIKYNEIYSHSGNCFDTS